MKMLSNPITTNPITTNPITTKPLTTKPLTTKPLTIAIFQGWDIRHFEMLGYLLDFCISHSQEFTLFSPQFKDWKPYYDSIFKRNIEWKPISDYSPTNFDFTFLVTDDDPYFHNEWADPERTICIDHWTGKIRRNNVLIHVNTRYATKYNNIFWALPTYPVILTADEKLSLLNQNQNPYKDKIHVTCIGYNSTPKSADNLRDIIVNYDDVVFHIVNHYIHYKYDDVTNIKEYIDADVKLMTDLLRMSDYVLCLQNNTSKDYVNDTMSAAIPLAFNFGCQLIMPTTWNNSYQYTSPIMYNRETYPIQKITLTPLSYDAITSVIKERDRLVTYRNTLFKGILRI